MELIITKQCLSVIEKLREEKYFSLIVGGKVRDSVLGIESKDVDIEVYGITYEDLVKFLSTFGKVNLVGKAFGVIKIKLKDGEDYDFSIPRRDSKVENNITAGRGIIAEFDIKMTPKEAASRRDFTCNSIGYDPIEKTLYDYFGGIKDIENNILRATSKQFCEDPLRVLRGMQILSRIYTQEIEFNTKECKECNAHKTGWTKKCMFCEDYNIVEKPFCVELNTIEVSKTLKKEKLVIEREAEEWMKFFTKCKFPSKSLQYLIDTEWIERYPELNNVINIEQDPEWHPCGLVGEHIKHCIDAAVEICEKEKIEGDNKAVIISAVLCHDIGKSQTTKKEIVKGKERITSKGHDFLSEELTISFLERIGIKQKIIEKASKLARYHMEHLTYDNKTKRGNIRQIAEKLFPATIKELLYVMEADHSGRPPLERGLSEKACSIKKDAIEEGVYEGKVGSYLSGKDIMDIFNTKQGKIIGDVLKEVGKKQLRKEVNCRKDAVKVANKYLQSRLLEINGKDIMEIVGVGEGKEIGKILDYAWRSFLGGKKVDCDWLKDFNEKRLREKA